MFSRVRIFGARSERYLAYFFRIIWCIKIESFDEKNDISWSNFRVPRLICILWNTFPRDFNSVLPVTVVFGRAKNTRFPPIAYINYTTPGVGVETITRILSRGGGRARFYPRDKFLGDLAFDAGKRGRAYKFAFYYSKSKQHIVPPRDEIGHGPMFRDSSSGRHGWKEEGRKKENNAYFIWNFRKIKINRGGRVGSIRGRVDEVWWGRGRRREGNLFGERVWFIVSAKLDLI